MGIGGGGDVVGALAVSEMARWLGAESVLGGVAWERLPIDSRPGPRSLDEVAGAQRIHPAVALAGPDTTGPGGFAFAESHMAAFTGQSTVLVDPTGGPSAVASGLAEAARQLDCREVVLVDVGGDVLAHGDEAGLASPLCDAVMLAAAPSLAHEVGVMAAVFGASCDGELTPGEVSQRLAEVAAAGGLLGAAGLAPRAAARLQAAIERVPTEASAQALACARGALGPAKIRGGLRTVQRTPLGGVAFFLDPEVAIGSAAQLARAVADAPSLLAARDVLGRRGVRTELDFEREHEGTPAGG